MSGNQLRAALVEANRYDEARQLLRDLLPRAEQTLGPDDILTLDLRWNLVLTSMTELSYKSGTNIPYTEGDRKKMIETKKGLEEILRRKRQILGPSHPNVLHCQRTLVNIGTLGTGVF